MDKEQLKARIATVKRNLRFTKVVATRSLKTKKRGDFFAGFAGAWNTVQDDVTGPGADLDMMDTEGIIAANGMTILDAVIAHEMAALRADLAVYGHARAANAITAAEYKEAVRVLKLNHAEVLNQLAQDG
jgi:hypothetical protein